MSLETIVFSVFYFALLSGIIFFAAILKDWPLATYAIWTNIFIIMIFWPNSPWKEGEVWANVIFVVLWSKSLFLFAKKKRRSAFWVSLLTLGVANIFVFFF